MLLIINAQQNSQYTLNDFWQRHFDQSTTVQYPVIFLHGINGNTTDWEKTVTILSKNNCQITYNQYYHGNKSNDASACRIWNLSYYEPNLVKEMLTGRLMTYAHRLQPMIEYIKQQTNQKKVVIIAHGMGGLVARAYMVLNDQNWDSVYKILTVGTPNEGVPFAPPIIGHWRDLNQKSVFIKTINKKWKTKLKQGYKLWGVIGAVDVKNNEKIRANTTDSGGIGYIRLDSAIPFEEWREVIKQPFDHETYNTSHFGYRVYTQANHDELLYHHSVFKALIWATKK